MGLFPDAIKLSQLITRLCRKGKSGKVWDLLHDTMKLGGSIDAPLCNALLTGWSRANDFQRMNLLLAEMKDMGVQPSVITFGILVNHLCKFRRVDEALQMLRKMNEGVEGFSVKPNVVIYNTVIDGLCQVGGQDEGLELEQMRLRHGVQPDVVTLNTMVDGMCRNGRINSAIQFFNEMQEKGLKGVVITYSALINAFCKMLSTGLVPTVVPYAAFINAYCLNGDINTAMKVFEKMNSLSKVAPNAVIYTILIDNLCKNSRVEDALSLMENMKSKRETPRTFTYNAIFRGLQKSNNLE
ncbi:Pentatricopeptide repeat [Dillenia turbinata]|uniref:Pentatricopeptide repeat n=1 Tax=Dillenia turbinata TaxID=194707 RepID=A0AAN8V281_9MAGN